MDLSIPQHFTKEQSDWIKMKFASNMPTVEAEDGTIGPMWLEEMATQLKGKYNE